MSKMNLLEDKLDGSAITKMGVNSRVAVPGGCARSSMSVIIIVGTSKIKLTSRMSVQHLDADDDQHR